MKKFLSLMLVMVMVFATTAPAAFAAVHDETPMERAVAAAEVAIAAYGNTNDLAAGTVAVHRDAILAAISEAFESATPPITGITPAWVMAPVREGATVDDAGLFAGIIVLTDTNSNITTHLSVRLETEPASPWDGLGFEPVRIPSDPTERSYLQYDIYRLVNEFGPRLFGTPNAQNAADFIAGRFLAAGVDSNNVEVLVTERQGIRQAMDPTRPLVAAANSQAWDGRLAFDGHPDIYGNAFPNTNAFPTLTNPQLVDLGTFPNNFGVPEGVTGDIVGAVRFEGPHLVGNQSVAELAAALEALDGVNVQAIVISRVGRVSWENTIVGAAQMPGIATMGIPAIATTHTFMERALRQADALEFVGRSQRVNDYSVLARLPASVNPSEPEMVIVVTAHKDSVMASPGASDNASGATSLIELARYFANVNRGGVELWFLAVSSHEGGGVPSVHEVMRRLRYYGLDDIAINFNMDMVGSPGPLLNGLHLDNIAIGVFTGEGNPPPMRETRLRNNLPATLLLGSDESYWAPGIVNTSLIQHANTDSVPFLQMGIDSANVIFMNEYNAHYVGIHGSVEMLYHTSRDNLEENYCYLRHRMTVNILRNAITTAIDELTKTVQFDVCLVEGQITILNYAQIFSKFDRVEGRVDVCGANGNPVLWICDCPPGTHGNPVYPYFGELEVVFAIEYPTNTVTIPGLTASDFENVRVTAIGSGSNPDRLLRVPGRDNAWVERFSVFESRMRAEGFPDDQALPHFTLTLQNFSPPGMAPQEYTHTLDAGETLNRIANGFGLNQHGGMIRGGEVITDGWVRNFQLTDWVVVSPEGFELGGNAWSNRYVTMPNSNVTLQGDWLQHGGRYALVVFDANSGEFYGGYNEVEKRSRVHEYWDGGSRPFQNIVMLGAIAPTPEKPEYELLGWATTSGGEILALDTLMDTPKTLYAVWKLIYVPTPPRILEVISNPVTIEQGNTATVTVVTENMPTNAWVELNVAWRAGLSIVGGSRFYVDEAGIATITIAATSNAPLGSDGFGLSARIADEWGTPVLLDYTILIITIVEPPTPAIVEVIPSPVTIEQGSTTTITVATENMPAGAWIDLNVAWRAGLSIVGGPRFYIGEDGTATVTVAAAANAPLGRDGFAVAARIAGDWGSVVIIDSYAFVIEII